MTATATHKLPSILPHDISAERITDRLWLR